MNIFFTTLTYYPDKNGVQMVNEYLAEGLTRRGHNVTVICCLRPDLPREEEHNGVHIVRFSVKTVLKHDTGEKKEFQAYLLDHIREGDALVTVSANMAFAVWTYPLLNQLLCRKIMYQHGMYDGRIHLNKVHSAVRLAKVLLLTPYWELFHRRHWKSIMKYDAAVHLFKADSSYTYFERHGFKNNHVIVNSCQSVCFGRAQSAETCRRYGIEKPYFIYVANMCSRKDQLLTLECYCKTKCKEKLDLVLVASKENAYARKILKREKELRERTELRNGAVHILFGISREDTVELIKNSYACLMTSNNEYLPITIIEAMASEKPFISTNVGVVPKLPGGNLCYEKDEICYWMDYYAENPDYVKELGKIAGGYARVNCYPEDKVEELERICRG